MTCDYFVALSRRHRRDLQNVDEVSVKYHHLAATDKKAADGLREQWQNARLGDRDIRVPIPQLWTQIATPAIDLDIFPPYTFSLQFPFRLTKSYLSKDERIFYVVDNPVRRDKVFKLPYVAPSSWKGSLRAALWKLGHDETHVGVRRLFGNAKGAEENFRAGRLHFFPTFFEQHSLEIINPHDRERKVGKNPILFESVPAGTPGVFTLLYVPFDRVGQDETETRQETAEDVALVADGVQAVFCIHGFGAKTSSGYGAAVEGFVDARGRRRDDLPEGKASLKAVLGEPLEVRMFRENYGRLDEFTSDEWKLLLENDFSDYEAAQTAHERHRRNVQTKQVSQEIDNFTEMVDALKKWANALAVEEEQNEQTG